MPNINALQWLFNCNATWLAWQLKYPFCYYPRQYQFLRDEATPQYGRPQ